MSKPKCRTFTNQSFCLPLVTKSASEFLSEIHRLSRHNRKTNVVPPFLCGRPIDLRKLYNEVAIRGGHKRVTSSHQWSQIYASLGLPSGCVESGHGLRCIYQRFLETFERGQRIASKGFAQDDLEASIVADTDSQEMDGTKFMRLMNDEEIPNHLRSTWSLSTDLFDRSEYNSLENALRSHLPNEIDFALNTLLLISCQPIDFGLHKNERLLSLLLQCVGIADSESILSPRDFSERQFANFWNYSVTDNFGRIFLLPKIFQYAQNPELSPNLNEYSSLVPLHDMAYGDDQGFRVQLVATVLRNLAVDGGQSAIVIGRSPQALRFIFLCIYANHSSLRQLGLETLSSLHFPVIGALIPVLRHLTFGLMSSQDRNDRIRGLQLVRRLCESPVYLSRPVSLESTAFAQSCSFFDDRLVLPSSRNVEFLLTLVPAILQSIVSTLCVRDLYLMVLALDTLYSLSSLGSTFCEHIFHDNIDLTPMGSSIQPEPDVLKNLVSVLISLLGLEARSMGSESLIRIGFSQTPYSVAPVASKSVPPTPKLQPIAPFISRTSVQPQSMIPSPSPTNMVAHPISLASVGTTHSHIAPTPSQPSNPPSKESSTALTNIVRSPSNSSSHSRMLLLPRPLLPTSLSTSNVSLPLASSVRDSTMSNLDVTSKSTVTSISSSVASHMISMSSTTPSQVDVKCGAHVPQRLLTVITSSSSAFEQKTVAPVHTNSSLHPKLPVKSVVSLNGPGGSIPNGALSHVELMKASAQRILVPAKPSLNKPLKSVFDHTSGTSSTLRRTFMFEWLRKNYAVHNHSSVPRVQIYTDYQHAHQNRFGVNINPVSPIEFHSEIKSIFPGVEQVKVQTPNGSVEIQYNNLRCVHAPKSDSEQGVNDIMAAVLSPGRPDVTTISLPKSKPQKRPLLPSVSSSLIVERTTVQSDEPHTASSKVARKLIDSPQNGHSNLNELINGQSPLNGLHRVTYTMKNSNTPDANSSLLSNGEAVIQPSDVAGSARGASHCSKLNDLVSRETNLVLLPVFTTLNFHPSVNNPKARDLTSPLSTNSVKCPTAIAVCLSSLSQKGCSLSIPSSEGSVAPKLITSDSSKHLNEKLVSTKGSDSAPLGDIFSTPAVSTNQSALVENSANFQLATCKWNMCSRNFSDIQSLTNHLFHSHLEESMTEVGCLWADCVHSGLLMSNHALRLHVKEKHLNFQDGSTLELGDDLHSVVSMPTSTCSLTALLQADCLDFPEVESPIVVPSSPESELHPRTPSDVDVTNCDKQNRSSMFTVRNEVDENFVVPERPPVADRDENPVINTLSEIAVSNCLNSVVNECPPQLALQSVAFSEQQCQFVWSSPIVLSEDCRKALAGGSANVPIGHPTAPEGPITKHIRLTAALILKNLLQYSRVARHYVACWESLLCELAFSALESAPTIFECLAYLNQNDVRSTVPLYHTVDSI